MTAARIIFPLVMLLAGGCVHSVKGAHMKIKITRTPACHVDVTMDSKLVFTGKAAKPCPKR